MNTERLDSLIKYISKFNKVAVAFSGGVDSTFLLKTAKMALGNKIIALSINSPYVPNWEIDEAIKITKHLDILHKIFRVPIDDSLVNNPTYRCYLCKKILFNKMLKYSKEKGYDILLDGTNIDDTKDYRPGLKALEELNIRSPLKECGFTKKEIRDFSKQLGLSTYNKHANACLMTRFPHNTNITQVDLIKVEEAEIFIHSIGIDHVRVRVHKDIARIEIDNQKRCELFDREKMDKIVEKLKILGYKYITMDMEGYKMGSLNEENTNDIRRG